MKFVFYYMLDGLKNVFFPPISLPKLERPIIKVQDVKYTPFPSPKRVGYQPPQSVRKDVYLKGHRQR